MVFFWPSVGCILTANDRVKLRSQQAQNGKMKGRYGQEFENCVETGFEIASYRGPLCAEPVQGMAYFVESVEFNETAVENESGMIIQFLAYSF